MTIGEKVHDYSTVTCESLVADTTIKNSGKLIIKVRFIQFEVHR